MGGFRKSREIPVTGIPANTTYPDHQEALGWHFCPQQSAVIASLRITLRWKPGTLWTETVWNSPLPDADANDCKEEEEEEEEKDDEDEDEDEGKNKK